MKAENQKVFQARVAKKLAKSRENGTIASWSNTDHFEAMAECLANVEIEAGQDPVDAFYQVVADTYNVSAYQKHLNAMSESLKLQPHFITAKQGAKQSTSEFEQSLIEIMQGKR